MTDKVNYGNYQDLMQLDLKSMIAFIVVVETGNLYSTSLVLGCSQPAVSVYLKRMRNYFPGQLFTREGRSLIPTTYAHWLSNELKKSFAGVHGVLSRNIREDFIGRVVA